MSEEKGCLQNYNSIFSVVIIVISDTRMYFTNYLICVSLSKVFANSISYISNYFANSVVKTVSA